MTKSESSNRTIFITSADSHMGHKVVERMLTGDLRDHFSHVIAGCVIPEKSKDLTTLGAKVVSYDIANLDTLTHAMKDSDLALIIPPGDSRVGALTTRMIDSAKAAKISSVILLSNIAIGSNQTPTGRWLSMYQDMEKHLKAQNFSQYCIIRPSTLQEDLLLYARYIQDTGTLRLPMGDGRISPIRMIDVADFFSRVLSGQGRSEDDNDSGDDDNGDDDGDDDDDDGDFPRIQVEEGGDKDGGGDKAKKKYKWLNQSFANKTLTITGSETMDGKTMARALSEATGKHVEFKDMEHQEAADLLKKNPMLDESEWGLMMEIWDLVRTRQLADSTPTYLDVMGRPQLSIHGFFRENASNFAPTRQ